jgi:hypothetical protein
MERGHSHNFKNENSFSSLNTYRTAGHFHITDKPDLEQLILIPAFHHVEQQQSVHYLGLIHFTEPSLFIASWICFLSAALK